jgi:MFS family permease
MPRAPERSLPEGHGPGYMELLRCRDLWGVSLGLFSLSYFTYFFLTWLPFYLVRERGLTMREMARVGAAYFFTAAISASICGRLSDYWIVRGGTPTRVRKGFMITGCMSGGGAADRDSAGPARSICCAFAVNGSGVRHVQLECFCDNAAAGGTAGGRAMVRDSIVLQQFVRSDCAGGGGFPCATLGTLYVGILHSGRGCVGGRIGLDLCGGEGRTGKVDRR